MTKRNSLLECPRCETDTLVVVGSDVTEQNVGIRRYQCDDCRNRFTALEGFFLDDEGGEDCFLNLALNHRLRERENHLRRTGKKPRRQLKPIDHVTMRRSNGSMSFTYIRSPRKKAVYLECKRGHPLNDETTYTNPNTGARTCKPCKRAYQKEWNREMARLYPGRKRDHWREYRRRKREEREAAA